MKEIYSTLLQAGASTITGLNHFVGSKLDCTHSLAAVNESNWAGGRKARGERQGQLCDQ